MRAANVPYVDLPSFRKIWTSFPANRCDRSFWLGLEGLCEPFIGERCPLKSQEYHSVPHTGRILQEDLHYIDEGVVARSNDLRMLYDAFTMWNPFGLAALLKTPINIVVDQLLLGVEYNMLALRFVVSCRSCAYDLKHYSRVSEVPFTGTYHTTNAFRCPMCTDLTEITSLNSVSVFFTLQRLNPVFQRSHHRSFVTDEAVKHRLETFFCPTGAGFATALYLPRGKYILAAPFMASMVEFDVQLGAEAFGEKDPFIPRIVDLKKFCVEPQTPKTTTGKPRAGAGRTASVAPGRAASIAGTSTLFRGEGPEGRRGGPGGPQRRTLMLQSGRQSRMTTLSGTRAGGSTAGTHGRPNSGGGRHPGVVDDNAPEEESDVFLTDKVADIPPTQSLELKHGKVQLRVYNTSEHSGFLDLYVHFDRRAEFSAPQYPKQFSLPDLLHCMPRGLRSRHLPLCIPLPPSETLTKGVFVRHDFDFSATYFIDAEVLSVLREVHGYSLEDQQGLLISVSDGGTRFESSFLSVTAALASSICFLQRVLVRLGDGVASSMRTSITEGPLMLGAYQGQYNDAENMRSAYPDVQLVGPVLYVSNHPPIAPPTLYACISEAPTVPVTRGHGGRGVDLSEYRQARKEEEFEVAAMVAAQKANGGGTVAPKSFMPWLDDDGTAASASTLNAPAPTAPSLGDRAQRGMPHRSEMTLGDSSQSTGRHGSLTGIGGGFGYGISSSASGAWNDGRVTKARFELRSVRRSGPRGEVTLEDVRAGSVPLSEHYASLRANDAMDNSMSDPFPIHASGDGNGSIFSQKAVTRCEDDDVVLPYFLKYLEERLEGTEVVEERHARVVLVPLQAMHASLQLSSTLDRSSYIKEYLGPF